MRKIPEALKAQLLAEAEYKKCVRKTGCQGRITLEHAIIYAGRQLNERWAILPLCAYHHAVDQFQDGGDLQKELNVWIALNRATDEELTRISKVIDYKRERERLNAKIGFAWKP